MEREEIIAAGAEALFAYNTPQALHFVIHDGGYEEITTTILDATEERIRADERKRAAEEVARRIAEFRDGKDWREERNTLEDAYNIALEVGRE